MIEKGGKERKETGRKEGERKEGRRERERKREGENSEEIFQWHQVLTEFPSCGLLSIY